LGRGVYTGGPDAATPPSLTLPHKGGGNRSCGTRHLQSRDSILRQQTQLRDLAARCARVFARTIRLSIIEGAGNAGCPMHPQPRVQMLSEAHERSHHGHTGFKPGIPRAMVLRLTSCSPRRSGSFVTVVSGYGFVRARSGRLASVKLDAGVEASEPHDFTVRFSAVRLRAVRSLTGSTPALRSPRARGHCRVHRIPFPTSVTIAKRPSVGRDDDGYKSDLGQAGKEIFFEWHIDEALVWSRPCQPLTLVVLYRAARTARRRGPDEADGSGRSAAR
jgi:hypothetical protein